MSRKLRGAIVDDKPYWRRRLPIWFNKSDIELHSFSNYDSFEEFLRNKGEVDFVLGDYHIYDSNLRQIGIAEIEHLIEKYDKNIGLIYIYTVLSAEEYEEKCLEYGIESTKYVFIDKSTKFYDLIRKIKNDCQL